jgi:hypothetical protein
MKTMKFEDMEMAFLITHYTDTFQREAVLAYDTKAEELYADVTINIPQYPLDDGECFLGTDSPELIREMERQGYLEISSEIRVNYGTYKVGKFTPKFYEDFRTESEDE